ncbi:bacteriocin [Frateuria sp. Soil773]|uniref:family 1 encapsulin nanocompartment shell protein n=1 Tax=Frateuria sp. Soil773 TaxID=1736407 RepID=UPI0006F8B0D1|nr:family 1 encapsulin nanocompartment shell protein [Frateuria sp. Soil773]KRE89014.1 bacteriocin [Frateuria sp. Soil773]
MNNLHRKLAPVSEGAWKQVEQEASRTLKRYLAGRRVVDVVGPKGFELSSVGTGHLKRIAPPADGIESSLREVRAIVELRVPFELTREAVDSVERGANDPDLQPLKDAARKIAFAEDRVIFEGYQAAGIAGLRAGASNKPIALPAKVEDYPGAVARAVNALRDAGVNGPYKLLLGEKPYTCVTGSTGGGYPLVRDIEEIMESEIVWAPAIQGGAVVSTRGGDFELHLGQDFAIGYLSHDAQSVQLYLQETLTFLQLTAEAVVMLDSDVK